MIFSTLQSAAKTSGDRSSCKVMISLQNWWDTHGPHTCFDTAVKSNALAELMNRASKIHWKNLSLTLNGRNSETKNDKNNPKVPFFQYVQLLRNISFLLKWSFLAKICCCCQMCYFPKLSIFFKMCVVCKMFGLGHNVRFFQNGFCQNVCFW